MFSPKADGRFEVQIPAAADDRPSWTKVGVMTAIGFVVGIAWPRMVGVRLGPSLPSDATPGAAVASAAPAGEASSALPVASASPVPPATSSVANAATASTPAAAASAPAPAAASSAVAVAPVVSVGHGAIYACKTSEGESLKGADCGTLTGLDGLVLPRLRKLAECADAAGVTGKLHLNVHVDFGRGGLTVDLGRSNTMAPAAALLTCARADVAGVSVGALAHENQRYSVAYVVSFEIPGAAAPAEPPSPATPAAAHAAGDAENSAQVVWEVALVRDTPKTGKVVARLQRGTTVRLGAVKDGWYPVKYGDGFSNDGWVFRGSIGR